MLATLAVPVMGLPSQEKRYCEYSDAVERNELSLCKKESQFVEYSKTALITYLVQSCFNPISLSGSNISFFPLVVRYNFRVRAMLS